MRAWHLLTIGTTDLKVHPMLALYGLYAAVTGHGKYMLLSLLSVMLHECAHGVCTALLGNAPRSIELTPLGAVMRLEDEYHLTPVLRGIVLIAGPAANCCLCMLSIYLTKNQWISADCGRLLLLSNLSILTINMLPALPLDGGRLIALILGGSFSYRTVTWIMRVIGYSLGICLIALNIYSSWKWGSWNLSLSFVGCTLLYGAHAALTTAAMVELRSFLDRKIRLERRQNIQIKWISTLDQVKLQQLIRRLPANRLAVYLCLEAGTLRTLGALTEADVIQHYLEKPDLKVGQLLNLYPMVDILHHFDTK